MKGLKTCPFCGGPATPNRRWTRRGSWIVFVKCDLCDAQTRAKNAADISDEDGFWEQDAIDTVMALWNTRTSKESVILSEVDQWLKDQGL